MNPKKKPDYDADKILREMANTAMILYAEKGTLKSVSNELGLNMIKIRKLLITAGVLKLNHESNICRNNCSEMNHSTDHVHHDVFVYKSATADEVMKLKDDGRSISEIMAITGLSKSSVNSYLPYGRTPYKAKELSANADRIGKYRERKAAVGKLKTVGGTETFWLAITAFQDYSFYTDKGVKYAYKIIDGALVINRGKLSIPGSIMEMAFSNAQGRTMTDFQKKMEAERQVTFEMTYICPVLKRLEVFDDAE